MISLSALPAAVRVSQSNLERTFELSVPAVERACAHLGVEGEVVIGFARYANGSLDGKYMWVRGRHSITLCAYLTPAGASVVLWHELTHAKQECEGRRTGPGTLAFRGVEYEQHPREIEARGNEHLALEYPLATYPDGTWQAATLTYPLT